MLALHVNHRNAAIATHATHKQIAVIGGEHRATERITRVGVAVHGFCQAEIKLKLVVHNIDVVVMPVIGILTRYVKRTHRVVAPVGHGYVLAVMRTSYHLWQRTSLEKLDNAVGLSVNHCHGGRILSIQVIGTTVIRHPKISATVGEGALHRLAVENIQVAVLRRIMGEFKQATGLCPQVALTATNAVGYYTKQLPCAHFINHRGASLQGVHIKLLAVGMDVHRLG